jgi:hypothetical protein
MEIMKSLQMVILATVALAIGSQKAEAQWAVFDFATYGEVGAVWSENVSMNVKLAETLVQTTNILRQATQIYGLAEQESTFLSKGQIPQAVGFFAQVAAIPGHDSWNKVMREAGSLANADSAWQQMANPNMAARNRIAMADSFAASALQSLGNCNSAATTNGNNLGGLETIILSGAAGRKHCCQPAQFGKSVSVTADPISPVSGKFSRAAYKARTPSCARGKRS